MGLVYALDLIGTLVFAISGAISASERKLDAFGALVIAFVTAVGGGTLRDVLIGSTPVAWMREMNYLYLIVASVILTFFFKERLMKLRMTFFLFDTIGIGLFTILGVQKTLDMGLSPPIAVIMGTVSAVFGGVTRDILCNEVPLIFRKEVYATACMIGAICYLGFCSFLDQGLSMVLTVSLIIFIRIMAVKKKWSLPYV
jgi:uncharacterized membrane protein YeiH